MKIVSVCQKEKSSSIQFLHKSCKYIKKNLEMTFQLLNGKDVAYENSMKASFLWEGMRMILLSIHPISFALIKSIISISLKKFNGKCFSNDLIFKWKNFSRNEKLKELKSKVSVQNSSSLEELHSQKMIKI